MFNFQAKHNAAYWQSQSKCDRYPHAYCMFRAEKRQHRCCEWHSFSKPNDPFLPPFIGKNPFNTYN